MRKIHIFLAVLVVISAATVFVNTNSYAHENKHEVKHQRSEVTNHGDHHEEEDGCDHGATGKECREDPSDSGKDCEKHGNHGGVNEDHCATTTTTASESTVTTVPETTTTTVPGVIITPVPVLPVPDTAAPVSSTPKTLPATGRPLWNLLLMGVSMLVVGLGIRMLVK